MNKRIEKAVEAIMNIQDNYELTEVIEAIKLKQKATETDPSLTPSTRPKSLQQ